MQVLDSGARIPAAAAKQASYAGMIRYVAPFLNGRPNPKCITAAELADDFANGLLVGIVFEAGIHNAEGGAAQGHADGRVAAAACKALGLAPGGIIYAAVDEDLPVQLWATAAAYFDAFRAECVAAGYRQGGYGKASLGAQMLKDGHAAGWWESGAWSGTQRLQGIPGADLYQRIATVTVAGVTCDINDVWAADWGQWPRPTEEPEVQFAMIHVSCDHETGKGWAVINGVHPDNVVGLTPRSDLCPRVSLDESAALDGDAVVHVDLGTPTLINVTVDVAVAHI